MVDYRCQHCRWFDKQHKSLPVETAPDLGYCRKHRPVIYGKHGRHYGGWPLVDINDFCGEYRADESE
jgi:hypothetical protein